VDDAAFVRRAIMMMFEQHPEIEVVEVAGDGATAVELAKKLRPDVITLDVQMPVLDGLSALERIMRECPTPVIMFSSLTGRGGEKTLKALDLGAVDFIDKGSAGDIGGLARELTAKIQVAHRVDLEKLQAKSPRGGDRLSGEQPGKGRASEVVLIGTSTGGPPALQQVLSQIQATLPCPIVIVQHMPAGFTASLARRLDRHTPLTVREARHGERLAGGTVYLAPAGWHMRLRRNAGELQVRLDAEQAGHLHCPSVDALFESAAQVCGNRARAVVLTGMGKDGSVGARAIRNAGGRVLVEAEETAIVFGMPKAVLEAGGADEVAPLYQIAEAIGRMV
jgi:two-component system chemotaxis response regulator CheB